MGLSVCVGWLANMHPDDPEGASEWMSEFDRINETLTGAGLGKHTEPIDCEVWSADMFGYSGLHTVRRIAAYLAEGQPLPEPAEDGSFNDPVLDAYYKALSQDYSWLDRLFKVTKPKPTEFTHLIEHSDAEGYYIPIDFATVLVPDDPNDVLGGQIGSVQRLLAECERVREALQIPAELTFDDVAENVGEQGQGEAMWKRYGVETHTCLCLIEACRRSIKAGAAIVFT